jgi:hypothetical protein
MSVTERSIRQDHPKTMKWKGFWYISGYWLLGDICAWLQTRENFFSFAGSEHQHEMAFMLA